MSDTRLLNGDRNELGAYVRTMADLMGLRDYTVRTEQVERVEADNHQYAGSDRFMAAVNVPHGQRYIHITIDQSWPDWDADTLRATIAHELVHAHLIGMVWAFDNVQSVTGGALYDVLSSAYDDANEMATDAISRAWAETLPLPIKDDDPTESEHTLEDIHG